MFSALVNFYSIEGHSLEITQTPKNYKIGVALFIYYLFPLINVSTPKSHMVEYNLKVLDWDNDEGTVSVSKELGGVTGAVAVWESIKAGVEKNEESAEAAILLLAAWWRSARW